MPGQRASVAPALVRLRGLTSASLALVQERANPAGDALFTGGFLVARTGLTILIQDEHATKRRHASIADLELHDRGGNLTSARLAVGSPRLIAGKLKTRPTRSKE
jgi:hypothetical protein